MLTIEHSDSEVPSYSLSDYYIKENKKKMESNINWEQEPMSKIPYAVFRGHEGMLVLV